MVVVVIRRNSLGVGVLITFGVALLMLLGGCAKKSEPLSLTVSVASSLTEPFQHIHNAFAEQYGEGVSLYGNYGSSGSLAAQIVQGAPVDLFVTADYSYMDTLAHEDFLKDPPIPIGVNSLILVLSSAIEGVPESGSVADLVAFVQEQNLSLATGEPESVPLGKYAKEGLGELWDSVTSQLVFAKNANSAKYYFVSGSVDSAILYSSDQKELPQGTTVYPIAPDIFVTYYIGVLSDTVPELTQEYLDFLQSEGAEILATYGIGAVQ